MRRLILFRHAEAIHSSRYRDHERPLTEAGRKEAAQAGARLAELALPVDLVLVSDSTRTRETWGLASAALKEAPETCFDRKIYEAERHDLMEMARALPDTVKTLILVGHNPALADFATHFAGRGDHDALKRLGRGFPTGAVALFEIAAGEWRKLRWGDGRLTNLWV
ncbi:SixA phosphatase family protein [Rhodoblastus sp.]|uniref:SixA phosphatase family protein n=1 Tax=Rhodoblastus sp. TaxID=1962975 RepID=UPI003F9B66FD